MEASGVWCQPSLDLGGLHRHSQRMWLRFPWLHTPLLSIEDKSIFMSNVHELMQVSLMIIILPIISNSYHSFTAFQDLIHHTLKDILDIDQVPGDVYESVPSSWCVGCGQWWLFIVGDYAEVGWSSINLGELVCGFLSDFLHCRSLLVMPFEGIVEVIGVQVH